MAKLHATGGLVMLRKIVLSSVAATALVGSALAADLPRRAPPPVYVPPPAPVATWTGLYIGINGGGLWMNNRDFVTTGTDFGGTGFAPSWSSAAALAATNVVTINNRAQGLIGGTWGYNWQWNSFVVGTESDFDGVFGCRNDDNGNFGFFGNNNNTCGGTAIGIAPVGPPAPPGFSVQNQQIIQRRLDWLSTSRVRAGFLVAPSFLIYATGGVALGRVRVDNTIISSASPVFGNSGLPLAGISVLNDSRLKAGFAAGGGFEWQLGTFGLFSSPFFRDLSFKAEALYYDLGRSTLDQTVQMNFRGPTPNGGCLNGGCLATNTGIHTTWRNNG